MMSDIEFFEINQHNLEVFENLSQCYESEFSLLTQKMPNESGVFEIGTMPYSPYVGYLLYDLEIPVGFCVADVESDMKDIAEFYIIPAMRNRQLGYQLASMIFNQYPGQWQVRQIEGADTAKQFWRAVIKKYTQDQYDESVVDDEHWGTVTRQQFKTHRLESPGSYTPHLASIKTSKDDTKLQKTQKINQRSRRQIKIDKT